MVSQLALTETTDITPQNILTALPLEVEEVWIQDYLSRWPTPVGISYWDYDYVKTHPIKPLISEASGLNVQLADIGAGESIPLASDHIFTERE